MCKIVFTDSFCKEDSIRLVIIKFLFCFFIALSAPTSYGSFIDHTDILLGLFGNKCPNFNGGQLNSALGDGTVLKGIIADIQKDSECQEWLSTINNLLHRSGPSTGRSRTHEIDALRREVEFLEDALQNETNEEVSSVLATELAEKKVQLYGRESQAKYNVWEERKESLMELQSFLNSLQQSSQGNARCFAKYPGIVLQVAGKSAQAAEQANLISGALGAGMSALGAIGNLAISGLYSLRYRKSLKSLEYSTLPEGLMCAFEAMSNVYCESRQALRRIKFAGQQDISIFNQRWEGIYLFRNISYYNTWVGKIISGSPAGNEAQAERKKRAIRLRSSLDQIREDLIAILADGQDLINIADSKDKEGVRSQVIEKIISRIQHSNGVNLNTEGHPFFRSFIKDSECGSRSYFYDEKGNRVPDETEFGRCRSRFRNHKVPSLILVGERVDILLLEGEAYSNNIFSQVKENDPRSIFVEAELDKRNIDLSPLELMKRGEKYLRKMNKKYHRKLPKHLLGIIKETMTIFAKTISLLKEAPLNNERSIEVISKLHKLLAPNDKIFFISDRLESIIIWELRFRLKTKSRHFSQDVEELLRFSVADELNTLDQFMGRNLESVKKDLNGSMNVAMDNINSLADLFESKISRLLAVLYEKKKKYPSQESIQSSLNYLCAMSLTIPDYERFNNKKKFGRIRKKVNFKKYCSGVSIVSIYERSELSFNYDKLVEANLGDRMCGFYDYMIKNELFRRFRLKRRR